MQDTTDQELIAQYNDGEQHALEQLIDRHLKAVYNFVYRMTGSSADADDITQDAFFKAWKNIKKYDPQYSFKTWILSIARNTAIDFLRKKRSLNFSQLASPDPDDERTFEETIEDVELLPHQVFEKKELAQEVQKSLSELPPESREVVLLHLADDMTFEEIAEVLNQPMNTVKSRYRRALINLKKLLGPGNAPM